MGLKKDFIHKIAEHFEGFDDEGSVEINFNGSGDSFDSFYSIEVCDKDRKWLTSDWKFSVDDEEFFFRIIDQSGCEYNFNNAGTTGKIVYEEGTLRVETVIGYESYGDVEDEDDGESTATL